MLADQSQQIVVFFRRLPGQAVQRFRPYLRAQNQADFFIPPGIDAIQLLRARVDQLLDDAPFLFQPRCRERAALHRIKHAQKMLPLAKHNLRGPYRLPFRRISHQI